MEISGILTFLWMNIFVYEVAGISKSSANLRYFNKNSDPCPNECDPRKCAKLTYCNGHTEKDRCNCCDVCASDVWSPEEYRPPLKKGNLSFFVLFCLVSLDRLCCKFIFFPCVFDRKDRILAQARVWGFVCPISASQWHVIFYNKDLY